ncbi:hypothetical protein FACS189427_05600 [Planctomycetales bacterium]|nr:hypothetical protein FACS189427_05600 [Planctomycetales bacterium]
MVSGTPAIESNQVKKFQFSLPLDKYFPLNSQTDKVPDAAQAEQDTETAEVPAEILNSAADTKKDAGRKDIAGKETAAAKKTTEKMSEKTAEKTTEQVLADRDPFAKFLSADEIQGKVAAPAEGKLSENKSTENKPDAELKLFDKNIEKGSSEKPLLIKPQTTVLPSLTISQPQVPQPLYANQAKPNEIDKCNSSETVPKNIVPEKTNSVKKLPEWETVDSVLNRPVMYDTPSKVIPFPSVDGTGK